MKKIVALALCLVLALSLCATAFADGVTNPDKYELYLANSANMKDAKTVNTGKTASGTDATVTVSAAQTYSDGSGVIEYLNITATAAGMTGTYVKTTSPLATDFAVTEKGKTAVLYYVTKVTDTAYGFAVTEFKDFGLNCGQIYKSATNEATYYVDADGTVYIGKDDRPADTYNTTEKKALFDGEVITVYEVKTTDVKGTTDKVLKHVYYMSASALDGTTIVPTAFSCQNCGDKTTEFYKTTKLPAGKTADYKVKVDNVDYYVIPSGTAAATTAAGVTSAKTFDAGIAMYVGMSLMAVTGSAVVIGKKKEF